ncbi:helix-turn-helix domain-containing protein [Bacillus sp. FJAT-42376]|uniref:bifunctional transcriptional activator/DNA repair enzyme AdaA n=1 Tax=Bacillus sp. FJAT-42376 TaxID=2014076 RepID=UPI000F5039ED|nr:Ada metal-binding domain-containing protein [Bacillus sp. FJAT-42376]AZB43138.1 helix-turn-helix domain-containing protein [Bacillus sp. FJAT-42376]
MTEKELFNAIYEVILSRTDVFDGKFYVGITTTKIFCRPSCRSRTPKRENVRVFGSIHEAKKAGFRACKRCKPEVPGENGPDAELAKNLKAFIQSHYQEALTLNSMAAELAISPYHLLRVFKRMTGVTPSKYLQDYRMQEGKNLLSIDAKPIAEIAAETGFSSPSHFSSLFKKSAGCTPQEYRDKIAAKGGIQS